MVFCFILCSLSCNDIEKYTVKYSRNTVIPSLLIILIKCLLLQLYPSLKLIATRNTIFLVCPDNVGDDVIKEATSLVRCTVLCNVYLCFSEFSSSTFKYFECIELVV